MIEYENFYSIISQEATIVNVSPRDGIRKDRSKFPHRGPQIACDVYEISQERGELKGQTRER